MPRSRSFSEARSCRMRAFPVPIPLWVSMWPLCPRTGWSIRCGHAYPGARRNVTQFTTVIDQLRGRYEAITAAAGVPSGGGTDMTVVFDAGQNSEDNFAHLAGTGLRYVGSVPASDCPDLTALPASARAIVDQ